MKILTYLMKILIVLLMIPMFLIGLVATIAMIPFIILICIACYIGGSKILSDEAWQELVDGLSKEKKDNEETNKMIVE